MEKEEADKSDTWSSPDDDDNSPDKDYNEYTEDQKLNDRFDDAILNSNLNKKIEEPKNTVLIKQKPERKTFKETWEEVDEFCPMCHKVSKPAEGLNRQNIKRLFALQTDVQSLTILFLLIMCGLFAFSTYSYMTNPTNCSNFTILDAEVPQVYDTSMIDGNDDLCDYGDNCIVYTEDALTNFSETVYIHPASIPTTMDNMSANTEEYNIIVNITE